MWLHPWEGNLKEMFLGGQHQPPKKGLKQHVCECSVEFSGLISRKACSTVATELIKYVLVQRDQIPETFDSLLLQSEESLPQWSNLKQQQRQHNNSLQTCLTGTGTTTSCVSTTTCVTYESDDDRLKPLQPKMVRICNQLNCKAKQRGLVYPALFFLFIK